MLDSGVIVPVHEIFKPGEANFGDVVGSIRDHCPINGTLHSMPFNSSMAILYYNKDLYRKAGLDRAAREAYRQNPPPNSGIKT